MEARVLVLAVAAALGLGVGEAQSGSPQPQPQKPDQVEDPGQSAGKTQTGEAFVLEGEVSDEALRRYVQALREIGEADPAVADAVRLGEPVDPTAVARAVKDGRSHAGLRPGEIRALAERIQEDASVRARYARIARAPADAGRSGASSPEQTR